MRGTFNGKKKKKKERGGNEEIESKSKIQMRDHGIK